MEIGRSPGRDAGHTDGGGEFERMIQGWARSRKGSKWRHFDSRGMDKVN